MSRSWWTKRPEAELSPAALAAYRERRERLLRAAFAVFKAEGPEAPVAQIAAAAEMGMSSFYRTFTGRDELLDALAEERVTLWVAGWRRALEKDDPWTALVEALWEFGELEQRDPALAIVLRERALAQPQLVAEVEALGVEVVERAKAAGAVRRDAVSDDVTRIYVMMGGLPRASDDVGWRRMLALFIDGLRAGGTTPLAAYEQRPAPDASVGQMDTPPLA